MLVRGCEVGTVGRVWQDLDFLLFLELSKVNVGSVSWQAVMLVKYPLPVGGCLGVGSAEHHEVVSFAEHTDSRPRGHQI